MIGETTGLTFEVQLKGTDGSGRSWRINRDHLRYWNSLDVPVLIVVYEAQSQVLRGRCAHSVPLGAASGGPNTLTVQMDPEIDISAFTPEQLSGDLLVSRHVERHRDRPRRPPPRDRVLHPKRTGVAVRHPVAILAQIALVLVAGAVAPVNPTLAAGLFKVSVEAMHNRLIYLGYVGDDRRPVIEYFRTESQLHPEAVA